VIGVAALELNAEQIRITFVPRRLASLVLDHLDYLTSSSMIAVEIGIVSIRNVNANTITDLKSSH
jgi:hypothetical protein